MDETTPSVVWTIQISVERTVQTIEDFAFVHEDAVIEVTLDGETRTVPARAGQLVLEALEDAGLRPPYSCRAGCCAACMVRLVEGEVEMLSNSVLDDADLGSGWILACQSLARTPRLKIRYPD